MADSRPTHNRKVSTNLGATQGYRPLQGKLAIITGASRGILSSLYPHTHFNTRDPRHRRSNRPKPSLKRRKLNPKLHLRHLHHPNHHPQHLPLLNLLRPMPLRPSRHGHTYRPRPSHNHSQKPLLAPQNRKIPNRHPNQQRRRREKRVLTQRLRV